MKRSRWSFVVLVVSMNTLLVSCNDRTEAAKDGGSMHDSAHTGVVAARDGKDVAAPWNVTVATYDSFVDNRNGRSYRTVAIGNQVWMAENLDLKLAETDTGWCFDGDAANCVLNGRLYTWKMAMGRSLRTRVPGRAQGICPDGWFVPSAAQWDSLVAFVERDQRVGKDMAAVALRASGLDGFPGKDLFGFRGVPAGYRKDDGSFLNDGHETYWLASDNAFRGLNDRSNFVVTSGDEFKKYEGYAASLRCIK